MQDIKNLIAQVLEESADYLTASKVSEKITVGVTLLGSEHGEREVLAGAETAQRILTDVEVVVIGSAQIDTPLKKIVAEDEEQAHRKMDQMLANGELQAAVTMHYNFPIGVATVGLVVTPARAGKMFIASTTGTAAGERVEAMVRSAVHGVAVAKAYGLVNPTVGLLNVDGARQAERCLYELQAQGYNMNFVSSRRSDGGIVMRGNDLLAGTPEVMVTDSLTGNLLMKIFSAYTTGGIYESLGYGYGPGVGEGYGKIINIISRASGYPVIAGAIEYAAAMARGGLVEKARLEIEKANKAGLGVLFKSGREKPQQAAKMPPVIAVSKQIAGIDVLELENSQQLLWREGIYAETGMGCTGPIILVAPCDFDKALKVLLENNYISSGQ